MATQFIQLSFHLFPFLFRERWIPSRPFPLVMNGGSVDFLVRHRASQFLAHLRGSRLFRDGLLVLRSTASGVSICQVHWRFLGGLCWVTVHRCVLTPRFLLV
jgi:hypothetical protein